MQPSRGIVQQFQAHNHARWFPPDLIQAPCPLVLITGTQDGGHLPGDVAVDRSDQPLGA
jgi:hypothetical protein